MWISRKIEDLLKTSVLRGGYPELHERPALEAVRFHRSYVATYLERDLRMQLQVGNLRDFERFLRACAPSSWECKPSTTSTTRP